MKTILRLCSVAAGLAFGAGAAQAQAVAVSGPETNLVGSESRDYRGADSAAKSTEIARDEAIARSQREGSKPRSARAVPAKPEDVVAGAEVRDSKGVAIGTVESVTMVDAIVFSAGGKVSVPLEAFGKNSKGLLIGMTKDEFDAAVVEAASKP